MNYRQLAAASLCAASMLVLAGLAQAQDTGTQTDTTTVTDPTTTPTPTTTTDDTADDATDETSEHTGPGAAVSAQAKTLKDEEGSRKDAAKALKATALTNNPGFQNAKTIRNPNANKDEDDTTTNGKSGDHPTAEDHPDADDNPGNEDHASADDHPDADDNPGDVASEDHGRPDDLPGADDHPGPDDHPGNPHGGG